MIKYEKYIDCLFKITGVMYLIEFILYLFNIYQPYKWGTAGNMLVIGYFLLNMKYSSNKNK